MESDACACAACGTKHPSNSINKATRATAYFDELLIRDKVSFPPRSCFLASKWAASQYLAGRLPAEPIGQDSLKPANEKPRSRADRGVPCPYSWAEHPRHLPITRRSTVSGTGRFPGSGSSRPCAFPALCPVALCRADPPHSGGTAPDLHRLPSPPGVTPESPVPELCSIGN